jgi:MtaA/CmuA family methyltransferase
MTSRERVLALIADQPPDRTPVMPITMMLAADQIGVPYGRYALEHAILAEAQVTIANRFDFDHVSAITETREAPDCGATVRFFDDQPYALDESVSRLSDKSELGKMDPPAPAESPAMSDRLQAIRLLKERAGASKIVEGWVEGPCCAAADLRGINRLMLDFHDDAAFVRELFDWVVQLALRFAKAQVDAGADLIGIGDPAASLAGPRVYREFIWQSQKTLVDGVRASGALVRLHICGNTRAILTDVARLGADILDVDSVVPMADARARVGARQILLGGVDPVRQLLNGSPAEVRASILRCKAEAGPRYIIGGGCEVPRATPTQNLRMLALAAESTGAE